jgi:hypothetical protein
LNVECRKNLLKKSVLAAAPLAQSSAHNIAAAKTDFFNSIANKDDVQTPALFPQHLPSVQ